MTTILVVIDNWQTLRYQYKCKDKTRLQDLLDTLASMFKRRTDVNQIKYRTVGYLRKLPFTFPCPCYWMRGSKELLTDVTDLYVLPARKGNTLGNRLMKAAIEQGIQVHDLSYAWDKYACSGRGSGR